jgi:hypothetical protein
MRRGTFEFETVGDGELAASAHNVEALRKLWLDRTLVSGEDLGPCDPGDFDHGAWHVSCHLTGAGGVRLTREDALVWLEISFDPKALRYHASATFEGDGGALVTAPLADPRARKVLDGSVVAGFVEGSSLGHASAHGVLDPDGLFNHAQRQLYDKEPGSPDAGGKVWEHWVTLRDIRAGRPGEAIGMSVVKAYVELAAALGDRFAATVARGRGHLKETGKKDGAEEADDYGHPAQLCALVRAGFTSAAAATWDVEPSAIDDATAFLFQESSPTAAWRAASRLPWTRRKAAYYMFERKRKDFRPAAAVQSVLDKVRP